MNKKSIIYVCIAVYWALIIGSYFTDSEVYTEIVIWMFVIPAILAGIYLLIMLYEGIKNLFDKEK